MTAEIPTLSLVDVDKRFPGVHALKRVSINIMRGEVVGINSMIYSRSGGYQGIAFAIPIDEAMRGITTSGTRSGRAL